MNKERFDKNCQMLIKIVGAFLRKSEENLKIGSDLFGLIN